MFNGIIDEVKITDGESYTVDDGEYMHGKHSWYVEGSSNEDVVEGVNPVRLVFYYLIVRAWRRE